MVLFVSNYPNSIGYSTFCYQKAIIVCYQYKLGLGVLSLLKGKTILISIFFQIIICSVFILGENRNQICNFSV